MVKFHSFMINLSRKPSWWNSQAYWFSAWKLWDLIGKRESSLPPHNTPPHTHTYWWKKQKPQPHPSLYAAKLQEQLHSNLSNLKRGNTKDSYQFYNWWINVTLPNVDTSKWHHIHIDSPIGAWKIRWQSSIEGNWILSREKITEGSTSNKQLS